MSDDDMTPLEREVFDTFILGFGMTTREADAIQAFVESALASERAKRVEAEALAERWKSVDAVTVTELLAAEATIERMRAITEEMSDDPKYPLELWWRTRIIGALTATDTSALARHDAEVLRSAAQALRERTGQVLTATWLDERAAEIERGATP